MGLFKKAYAAFDQRTGAWGGGGGGGVEGAGEEGDLLSPLMAFSNIHVIDIFTIY